ncbi:unnamed protein product, partial [Owenia fusiformis]
RPTVWQDYQAGKTNSLGISSETPMVWTTNDPNDASYHPLNIYGPNYWLLDVLVRCETLAEENGYLILKGKVQKGTVSQLESGFEHESQCSGSYGATYSLPFPMTDRHFVVCGKINVMEFGSGICQIDNF